jgi:hypothetical protein
VKYKDQTFAYNIGYNVENERIGMVQHIFLNDEELSRVYLVKAEGEYHKVPEADFLRIVNESAAIAQEKYDEQQEELYQDE